MSPARRFRGIKILKAVSSPLRLQILNLMFDRGPLSYTELMNALKMNPSRDAGRFAYHLKFLLKADLIEADADTKKYFLTELGKLVLDAAENIQRKAATPKRRLVRTSRFALEEFDASKIASSLVKEAKMAPGLAQKVAKEAEKRLLRSKTKYLTAPLVREVVNALLIRKGLEEYRHKLTRLGLPVYDVTALVDFKSKTRDGAVSIHETAGEMVLQEYTLLNILPRDVADLHVAGSLHLNNLSSWILKPHTVMHDLRSFFHHSFKSERITIHRAHRSPQQTLAAVLAITLNVLLHSAREISGPQTVNYFNIFLAPFLAGLASDEIKEALRLFVANVQHNVNAAFSLELMVPPFLAEKPAFGLNGTPLGNYGDFVEESQLVTALLLEICAEESELTPLLNPTVIVKIRPETFVDAKAKALLLDAHNLASQAGVLYFANLLANYRQTSTFSPSGFQLHADASGDWELDTLRTGCLGYVSVNLPRIAYESAGDRTQFLTNVRETVEIAARSLEIKRRAMKQHSGGLLPFLTQTLNGDSYYRLETAASLINVVGLPEAISTFNENQANPEKSAVLDELVKTISASTRRTSRKRRRRLAPARLFDVEASTRLVQLDIERYGITNVRFSGTKETPFYSTITRHPLAAGSLPSTWPTTNLDHRLTGGNLTVIDLGDEGPSPRELLATTQQVFERDKLDLITYNREVTYCVNCQRSVFGKAHKCPSCGATSTLHRHTRFPVL